MLNTRPPRSHRFVLLAAALLASLLAVACGGGGNSLTPKQQEGITVEVVNEAALAAPTAAPQVFGFAPTPAVQPLAAQPTQTLPQPTTQPGAPAPTPAASSVVKPATPPAGFSSTPLPQPNSAQATARKTMDGTSAPTTGRWIDVDVTTYQVRFMNGTEVTRTLAPVAVGEQVDTGVYASTQTGTFRVHNKIAGLQYDAPYNTYISDWVAFDVPRANGFHSLLKDGKGNVVDASTGRVSNGCIRVGDSAAVFAYAEIGMVVYVHH